MGSTMMIPTHGWKQSVFIPCQVHEMQCGYTVNDSIITLLSACWKCSNVVWMTWSVIPWGTLPDHDIPCSCEWCLLMTRLVIPWGTLPRLAMRLPKGRRSTNLWLPEYGIYKTPYFWWMYRTILTPPAKYLPRIRHFWRYREVPSEIARNSP